MGILTLEPAVRQAVPSLVRRWWPAALLATLSTACAPSSYPPPGAPEPVPYADTLPIREPGEVRYEEFPYLVYEALVDEAAAPFQVDRWIDGPEPALDVTAFDEVVPSTWFEPRMESDGLTPAEVAEGAPGAEPADGELIVIGAKVGGVSPGFTVQDRDGERFLLKFDPPGHPGLSSGADIVSSRLFWAAGYNVPRDVVIRLDPERLVLHEETDVQTVEGMKPMETVHVDQILEGAEALPDGRYRTLASHLIPGTPKGPFRFEGMRDDDPNDYYPHEDRRPLRGVWVLASWLNHVDLRFQNTLDVFVEPTGYLRHYFIDFGATLGSGSIRMLNPREGREYAFDLWPFLARMGTLGAYRVGWESFSDEPIHPALGRMEVDTFEPGGWKPFWPNEALRRLTPRDGYWGAKLVGRFGEAHIRAVVEEARYPDPVAADTLVEILSLRRRRILRHWYGKVSPLEDVVAEADGPSVITDGEPPAGSGPTPVRLPEDGGQDEPPALWVHFRDLGLEEGLWDAEETRYRWRFRHPRLDREGDGTVSARRAGRQALEVRWDPADRPAGEALPTEDALATLEITAVRPGAAERAVVVRLLLEPEGEYRVVGLVH